MRWLHREKSQPEKELGLLSVGAWHEDYFVERELGRGGMGVAYLASDRQGNKVVIKAVLPSRFSSRESLQQFYDEIVLLLKIREYPMLVQVYNVTLRDFPLLVMQYVKGGDLFEYASRRRLSVAECWLAFLQLSFGLQHLFEDGIIHLDFKPKNLLIDELGFLRISDFGLARAARAQGVVGSGGTPLYMSPEQIRGEPLDHRADIWALGVTLYWLATGRHPFEAASFELLKAAILNDEFEAPSRLQPRLDRELEQIIARCLRKDRKDRFLDYRELCRLTFRIPDHAWLQLDEQSRLHPQGCIATGEVVQFFVNLCANLVKAIPQGETTLEKGVKKQPPEEPMQSELDRAIQLQNVHQYQEALTIINQVLQKHPTYPDALGLCGSLLWRMGKMKEATEYLTRAIFEKDPNGRLPHSPVFATLFAIYFASSEFDKVAALAAKAKQVAEEMSPSEREDLLAMLRGLIEAVKKGDFAKEYASANRREAAKLAAQGLHAAAIAQLKYAVSLDPNDQLAWIALGASYYESQRPAEAEEALLHAVELVPDNLAVWAMLAYAYALQGKVPELLKCVNECRRLGPNEKPTRDLEALLKKSGVEAGPLG